MIFNRAVKLHLQLDHDGYLPSYAHPRLAASTIAAVYRDRWRIETFFKSLKQLLKLKTFVGTSEKAVRTQIWTALIVMLLLRWMMKKAAYGWSLSNLVALLRMQLFVYRDLWTWLNSPFESPPAVAGLDQMPLPVPGIPLVWTA